MKNLWSSWRNEYITGLSDDNSKSEAEDTNAANSDCFLCGASELGLDRTEVVSVGNSAIIIMNKYPYNNGHLLVAPKQHLAEITDLQHDVYEEINALVLLSVKALKSLYNPQGINIGVNMGVAAGAGVPGHLHYHVLPRWDGDTNFMMTIADINVVSEAMEIGSARLRDFFMNEG